MEKGKTVLKKLQSKKSARAAERTGNGAAERGGNLKALVGILSLRDAEKLTELFHISESQQNYIINAPAGSGLLRYGGALVPFMNRFKTDTELYKLITTKPGE